MRRLRNLALFGLLALGLLIGLAFVFRTQWMGALGVNVDVGPGGEATLSVPAGYVSTTFASGLGGPRFMAVAPDGTLLVAERGADRVVALPDTNRDGRADATRVVGTGYGHPNSVAFEADGSLLVAGETTLHRVTLGPDGAEQRRTTVVDGLPATGAHATKTVAVLPDGRLLLAIGSSCNACVETDPLRATVQVMAPAGPVMRPYMVGLRNAVGLWVDPATGTPWATDMGRDLLGDDRPPETVYALVDGADAGWPRCHAGSLNDPEFGTSTTNGCAGIADPAVLLPAHVAPLALAGWDGHLVIALHGSWNSSRKVGYALWWLPWDGGPAGDAEPFATGFLPDGATDALGRPAGLAVGADGALYVSDDQNGRIYRIVWRP
jgi:glucose/arabinose dehydrogenase